MGLMKSIFNTCLKVVILKRYLRTHKNTYTHTPDIKTQNYRLHTLISTPHTHSILPGPGTKAQRGNQPSACLQPLYSRVETGSPPSHQSRLEPTPPEPGQPQPRPRPPR
ncbi:hypothetical protein ILYODFUR_035566 [Ilyodon furcidens]|uniref:Uncharacterized protein n=1 Tax=Ilyodon furcidens TaxID=33524 RepID=A0ABV0TGC5_9TELE